MRFHFKEDKATEAQLSYIEVLLAHLQDQGESYYLDEYEVGDLSKNEASEVIEDLKNLLGWS